MTTGTDRRAPDPRIDVLVSQVAAIEKQLAANQTILQDISDVMASFRVVSAIAKWTTAVVAAGVAIWHGGHEAWALLKQMKD